MADIKITNGICLGAQHTVTAAEATAGTITFNFTGLNNTKVGYKVAAIFNVVTDAGINVPLADAVITYDTGEATLANGAVTFALAENQVINIVASRVKEY